MLLVLLLTFAIGALGLNADTIWRDEQTTMGHIGALDEYPFSVNDLLESLATYSEQHSPGYFIVLLGWSRLVSFEPMALRLFSLFWGCLGLAGLYRIGKMLMSSQLGISAALLLGTSALYVVYLHEIRAYTMFMALNILTLAIYVELIVKKRERGLWGWIALFFAVALLMYTHYLGIILLAAMGLYHLLFVEKNRRWWILSFTVIMGGLTFLPWVPIAIQGFQITTTRPLVQDNAVDTLTLLQMFVHLLGQSNPIFLFLLIITGAFAGYRWHVLGIMAFLGLVMLILLVGINHIFSIVPLNRARYLLSLWIPFSLIFAGGILFVSPRWWIALILLIIWLASGYNLYQSNSFDDYLGGSRKVIYYPDYQHLLPILRDYVNPLDHVVTFSAFDLDTRASKQEKKSISDFYLDQLSDSHHVYNVANDFDVERAISNVIDKPFVWIVYEPQRFEEPILDWTAEMMAGHQDCGRAYQDENVEIYRYVLQGFGLSCASNPDYASIDYDRGISAEAILSDLSDSTLDVLIAWHPQLDFDTTAYNFSLQLLDGDFANLAQVDGHLDNPNFHWQKSTLNIAEVSEGSYQLVLIVYPREGGSKIGGITGTGETTDFFTILSIDIKADHDE